MKSITEFVFTSSGELERRDIAISNIDFNSAIASQIAASVGVKIRSVITMKHLGFDGEMHVSACVTPLSTLWTVPLEQIMIDAPFQCKDGVLWPALGNPDLSNMTMWWKVPPGMRVFLGINVGNMKFESISQFLIALDSGNRQYRLPLSNTYEDCVLCTGKYPGQTGCASHIDAVRAAVSQFFKGKWQHDLYQTTEVKNTRALFSFKVDGDKTTQMWDGTLDWTKHCNKCGNTFLLNNLIY